MPPAATTAAGRRTAARPPQDNPYPEARTKRAGQATHATHVPRAPRRVANATAPARPAPARPRTAPARPRTAPHPTPAPRKRATEAVPRALRIEQPAARPPRVERGAPRRSVAARLRPGGKLLDRIVRGRAWIPVLGVILVGIVGMRVEVLKLGSSVGAEMQQASQLQSANAAMMQEVSALSDNQRIEKLAAGLGMVMPLPTDIHLVQASSGAHVSRAIADLTTPNPSAFFAGLTDERVKDGESEQAAADISAVGVLGADDTPGLVAPVGTADSSTSVTSTDATTQSTQAPAATAATDAPASDSNDATTDQADAPASDSSDATADQADDSSSGQSTASAGSEATGATDTVPPVTQTGSNGAANLAG